MSWKDPGRRQPKLGRDATLANRDPSETGLFGPACLGQRIQAAALGAIGSLPRALRDRAAYLWNAANLKRLTEAMSHWIRGAELEEESFARLFFGREADDPGVALLRKAALDVSQATDHQQLGAGAEKLAAALQAIGLDRWSGFLAAVRDRALDPATVAVMETELNGEVTATDPTGGSVAPAMDHPAAGHLLPQHAKVCPTGWPDQLPIPGQAGGAVRPAAWSGGLPPPSITPPVRNPGRISPGNPSRPAAASVGGHSLWDEDGGEWQYHPANELHDSYWDYNEHVGVNSPWRNVPINDPPPRSP